ncbi:hypothetical protein F383_02131 [Gossypium arboreum]|uniref:Uncharacterized protein n=1 Tax=Gossypium arboreum TaxID=29729 RepID=A0A0B0Q2I0_GOSAR|nr:hypothetical protein F383_02131 [Gossypium arboreum]
MHRFISDSLVVFDSVETSLMIIVRIFFHFLQNTWNFNQLLIT